MQEQTKRPNTNPGSASQRNTFPSETWLPGFQGDDLVTWVKENQAVAMIGAFAIGVFVGAMIRD